MYYTLTVWVGFLFIPDILTIITTINNLPHELDLTQQSTTNTNIYTTGVTQVLTLSVHKNLNRDKQV